MDDEVAAKLVIGEGRQAALEREKFDLKALNNESFRLKFIKENRPWLLQHLVDLITPQSLTQPGPNGLLLADYVRNTYSDLAAMGKAISKANDKYDLSSDEDEEYDRKKRLEWSRKSLDGSSLRIAIVWLKKARKKRYFGQLVQNIILSNKEDKCHMCKRTTSTCSFLVAGLALDGKYDNTALDNIIEMFELQFSSDENDSYLWKSFFRRNANFITTCNICLNRATDSNVPRTLMSTNRVTRPDDISSDEEEENISFDPMIVSRTSKEGRVMSKWLLAARKKIGGVFPRDQAIDQTRKYVELMKKKKIKNSLPARKELLPNDRGFDGSNENLNYAGRMIAINWLKSARKEKFERFQARGKEIRNFLHSTLEKMLPVDDWFYGTESRLGGMALLDEGERLRKENVRKQEEGDIAVQTIENDRDEFIRKSYSTLESKREEMKIDINEIKSKQQQNLEERTQELKNFLEQTQKRNKAEEDEARKRDGALSSEMVTAHRQSIIEIEEMIAKEAENSETHRLKMETSRQNAFDQEEKGIMQQIFGRKMVSEEQIEKIICAYRSVMENIEKEWRLSASSWLAVAIRKVEIKIEEDKNGGITRKREK